MNGMYRCISRIRYIILSYYCFINDYIYKTYQNT
eukprot:UN07433